MKQLNFLGILIDGKNSSKHLKTVDQKAVTEFEADKIQLKKFFTSRAVYEIVKNSIKLI